MKVVLQKVKEARVESKAVSNRIGKGYMLLVGAGKMSTIEDAMAIARKIATARLFEDEAGKMNLSIQEVGGDILSISQFTLYADTRKGNRPSFTDAMAPDAALKLYEAFNDALRSHGLNVLPGDFGEMMDVSLINEGPVTIIYESIAGKIQ